MPYSRQLIMQHYCHTLQAKQENHSPRHFLPRPTMGGTPILTSVVLDHPRTGLLAEHHVTGQRSRLDLLLGLFALLALAGRLSLIRKHTPTNEAQEAGHARNEP